jgi:hypothetical protein
VVDVVSAPGPEAARGRAGTWRWTLLLPPRWVTLPTEGRAGRAAIRRLLDRRTAHLPRDEVATMRRRLELELRGLLGRARDAGVDVVHAHLDLMRGLPVTATCSVTLLHGGVDDPRMVGRLVSTLGSEGTVVAIDVHSLAGLPAIRRRRRSAVPVEGATGSVWSTGLDWVVPLPDGDGALLMTFSTVTEPVAEELVVLFDAIAGSLQLEPAAD